MLSDILHVGVTVSDLERSIAFYRDILGLAFQGRITMDGPETEKLFGRTGCAANIAYLRGTELVDGPTVELIQFVDRASHRAPTDIFTTSISEICFRTDDIRREYTRLRELGVEFLSEPQPFDFTADGYGKSDAVYLRDPDGLILELMEPKND